MNNQINKDNLWIYLSIVILLVFLIGVFVLENNKVQIIEHNGLLFSVYKGQVTPIEYCK